MVERRTINISCNHQLTVFLFPDPCGWLDLDQFTQQLSHGTCPDCPSGEGPSPEEPLRLCLSSSAGGATVTNLSTAADAYRLHKSGFDAERKIIHVPRTKTPKSKRDVPLIGQSLEILLRGAKETPTGHLFWPRQQHGKHAAKFGHVTTCRKAHDRIVKKYLSGKEFVRFDFRRTYAK